MCCASVIHVVILLVAGFSNIVRSWLLLFFFLEFCPCKEWKGLLNCWTANNIFHSLYYIPTAACNLNSYSRGYFVRGGVKCKLHVHWRLHFRMNFWTLHLEFSSQNVNFVTVFWNLGYKCYRHCWCICVVWYSYHRSTGDSNNNKSVKFLSQHFFK